MSLRNKKTNSKRKDKSEPVIIFSRCRECGKMINNKEQFFIITAARDTFCDPCYHGKGWQNLEKPYENYSEGRKFPRQRFKNDSSDTNGQ